MSSKPTEVRAFGSQLLAASKLIGKYCDDVNDEFILCKAEYDNPVHCVKIGRKVTECALRVYVPLFSLTCSDTIPSGLSRMVKSVLLSLDPNFASILEIYYSCADFSLVFL